MQQRRLYDGSWLYRELGTTKELDQELTSGSS